MEFSWRRGASRTGRPASSGALRTGSGARARETRASFRRHALLDAVRRRRNEARVSRARAPDPVLSAPELAGRPVRAAPLRQENSMDLAEEAVREREPGPEAREAVLEGPDVTGDFGDVAERNP